MSSNVDGAAADAVGTGTRPTPAERRRLLATLASRRIVERGFEGLSVNDLARDLGLSVGGLYRYIRTKSDLLVMACETIYGGLGPTVAAIAADELAPVAERLAEAVEVYLRECLRNRDQILLMYREYRHLPREAHQRYKDREREILAVFVGLIESGVRQRLFREVDAVVLAHDIILLGHLPALKGWSLRSTVAPDAMLTEQVELVLARLRT